jgi:hypothetical protein
MGKDTDYDFLAALAGALGRMAMGASNVDYVETEVMRALEWMQMPLSDRRLAVCLTLRESAQQAPTAFYSKTTRAGPAHGGAGGSKECLYTISAGLQDAQPMVCACAADALAETLQLLMERKSRSTTGLLCQIYVDVMKDFLSPILVTTTPSIPSSASHSHHPTNSNTTTINNGNNNHSIHNLNGRIKKKTNSMNGKDRGHSTWVTFGSGRIVGIYQ